MDSHTFFPPGATTVAEVPTLQIAISSGSNPLLGGAKIRAVISTFPGTETNVSRGTSHVSNSSMPKPSCLLILSFGKLLLQINNQSDVSGARHTDIDTNNRHSGVEHTWPLHCSLPAGNRFRSWHVGCRVAGQENVNWHGQTGTIFRRVTG